MLHFVKTYDMKLIQLLSISVFTIASISFSNCKKSSTTNPIDELPHETQTGANTFGCLVNGQAFKPGGASMSGGSLRCFYQDLGTGINGGYYFGVSGTFRDNSNGNGNSVGIFTDSFKIVANTKYKTLNRLKGNPYALYSSYTSNSPYQSFETDGNIYKGEFWIKKLDSFNQIVSGTFWFDAVNSSGQKVEVREGRFDMRYTR